MMSVGSSSLAASVLSMRAQVLAQNAALREATATPPTVAAPTTTLASTPAPVAAGGFGDAMRDALGQVNAMQVRASAASEAYDRGQTNDIAAVMMARQEASVGFEATLQVRNRLVSAYTDIMNMPL